MKMIDNSASRIVGRVSWAIGGVTDCTLTSTGYRLPFSATENVKRCLPHVENEHQQSANNCSPFNMVYHSTMWPLMSLYIVLIIFIH
jgi:hypothetical protein